MCRFLVSRVNSHQIDDPTCSLTPRESAALKKRWDVITVLPDGKEFGKKIENVKFEVFDSPHPDNLGFGHTIGRAAEPNAAWPHPDTGDPLTVNPKFYIIETPGLAHDSVDAIAFVEHGDPVDDDESDPRRKRRWDPILFEEHEKKELEETHRLIVGQLKLQSFIKEREVDE